MKRQTARPPAPARQTTPMGDGRFQELMRGASAFFAAAERDVDAEKAAAIAEIRRRMDEYGLTIEDLEA